MKNFYIYMSFVNFFSPLINYAADKLGLDQELFVPVFHALEATLTGNPVSWVATATGLASNVAKKLLVDVSSGKPLAPVLKADGIDPVVLKRAMVDFVADYFTKRFGHMGDVLQSRVRKHHQRVHLNMGAKVKTVSPSIALKQVSKRRMKNSKI